MNQPTPTAHALTIAAPSLWLRNAGIVLAGTALIALSARVALPLPFTPVPLTLQPFAVLLLGLLLPPRLAAGTLVAYLAEGAAGLPVFAPGIAGLSGIAHLFGPTGGYLLSYPLASYAIASLWRTRRRNFSWALVSAGAGNLIILAIGALWLGIYTHASAPAVLTQAVVPFLSGDALKVVAAAGLGLQWCRIRATRRPSRPTL